MKIIGLCGRSGSGKSTASEVFRRFGCGIINADEVSRSIMGAGSACLSELCEHFGSDIIRDDGTLNRRLLASRAFSDGEKAKLLNAVTHKYIVKEIENRISASDCESVVLDAPLLFEAGLQEKCDAIIGVIAPDNICISRAAQRDGISEEEAEKRLANQHGNDFLLTYCTHIINNSGTKEELEANAEQVISEIMGLHNA